MSRYGRYYFSSDYINNINRMKKKDRKKAEFFADITRDNKIKKSEAQELLDKGYTQSDLERYDSRTFNLAQEYYNEGSRAGEYYGNLNYSPLTISKGATNLFKTPVPPAAPATSPSPAAPSNNNNNNQTSATVSNPYQSQIDTLMQQITQQQQAAEDAAQAQQEAFEAQISDLTSGFDDRTALLTKGFQEQMEAADLARTREIDKIMAANQSQMLEMQRASEAQIGQMQTLQQERIAQMEAANQRILNEQAARQQQMQIAQATQAANAARAGQTGQFRVGGDRAVGGIGQFKRRLQIKPMTSAALSLAGGKSPGGNKMLNV